MKRGALVAAKVAVSLLLLAYLFATSDVQALEERVRAADLVMLGGAVACYALMIGLATWRWQLLLEALGCVAPLRHLTASYLIATFFNNFLPSNIGGDVVRVRDGSKLTGSTTASLAVVGIDRILGFGALYVLAFVAFVVADPVVRGLAGARAVIGGLALVFVALAYVFFRPGIAGRLLELSGLRRIEWVRDRFEVAQGAVHSYRAQMRTVWLAFGVSVALQALVVWYFLAVARSLRIPLEVSAAFLMVPLCTLLQAVPVSFNGWGLRESLFTLYFTQVGLPRDGALAFSLLGAGLIILLSLSGAVVWLTRGGGPPPAAEMPA